MENTLVVRQSYIWRDHKTQQPTPCFTPPPKHGPQAFTQKLVHTLVAAMFTSAERQNARRCPAVADTLAWPCNGRLLTHEENEVLTQASM